MPNLIPHWIHERLARQVYRGALCAATMFVDVAGFTPLTETLMQHPKEGAEALTAALNRVFSPLVQMVYAHGGFVSTFAGDAFTALFPQRRRRAALHAAQAALLVRHFFGRQSLLQTPYGDFELIARMGLSSGRVQWGIAGNRATAELKPAAWAFFFRGKPIAACAQAARCAAKGEVVADERFLDLLGDQAEAEPLPTPGYFALRTAAPLSSPTRFAAPALPDTALQPFAPDAVIRFAASSAGGEFRQVAPAFISFEESSLDKLDRFVSTVAELTGAYGGYLNKLDFGDKGGVILVLFGAPVAHENDLVRAADFLLALRSQTTQSGPAALPRWRAGLSFGTAYSGMIGGLERSEYTAIGSVVNLAARLMQAAPWGEIWTSAAAAHSLERGYLLKDAGAHPLKGLGEAQAVWTLGQRRAQRAGGSPIRHTDRLWDRERELERLHEFVRPLAAGRFAGMLTVIGEVGMGKSRLLHAFARKLADGALGAPPLMLWAQTDEVLRQSLNPFRYALRDYFDQAPTDPPEKNQARFARVLSELLAALRSGKGGADGPTLAAELERTRSFLGALVDLHWPGSLYEQLPPQLRFENMLSALITLLRAEGKRRPVILVLEELQWLDADSRQLLLRLSRVMSADAACALAVLATARTAPPVDLLDPTTPQVLLPLGPLPNEAIVQLAQDALGAPVAPPLVALLAERAEGNPFFAVQLLRYLQEHGLLSSTPEGLVPTTSAVLLPADVRAVFAARLDRLPPGMQQVVQAAAVLGRQFEVPVLSRMLPQETALAEKLAIGEREEIWTASGETSYLFKQALLRDVAYEMQLRPRLRDLHTQALAALEEIYRDAPQSAMARPYDTLAYHAEHSGNAAKQREYYRLAGEASQAAYRNAAAQGYYERLLPLLSEPAERADILLRLGAVLEVTGHWGEAEDRYHQALDLAEQSGDAVAVANCQNALGTLLRQRGEHNRAWEWLEKARAMRAASGDRAGLCRTLTEMGTVAWRQRQYAQAEGLLRQALGLARELNDRPAIVSALNQMGNLHWGQRKAAQAKPFYEESLALARQLGDKRDIAGSLNNLAVAVGEMGDHAHAQALMEESLALRREVGDKPGVAMALNNLGWFARVRGENDKALTLLEEYQALCREIGDRGGLAVALNNLGLIVYWFQDLPRARSIFEENLALFRDLDYPYGTVTALANLGLVHLEQGDLCTARELLAESLAGRQTIADREGQIFNLIGLLAVAVRQWVEPTPDQVERAARLAAFIETLPYPGQPEPVYIRLFEKTRAAIRSRLNEVAQGTLTAAGRSLTLESATEMALEISALGST